MCEDIRELGNTGEKYGGKYSDLYGHVAICTADRTAVQTWQRGLRVVFRQIQNPMSRHTL
jgi:hypothetical protein